VPPEGIGSAATRAHGRLVRDVRYHGQSAVLADVARNFLELVLIAWSQDGGRACSRE
jgi:hypothetical protein